MVLAFRVVSVSTAKEVQANEREGVLVTPCAVARGADTVPSVSSHEREQRGRATDA